MVTFKEYLETCRFSNSPEAEFVAEALENGGLSNARSWPELRASLEGSSRSQRLISAAEVVWRDYEEAQARA